MYRQATKVAPDYAFTYNNFGNLMRVLGDFDMDIDLYQKAINIQPDYADCHYSLGIIHLLLGDYTSRVDRTWMAKSPSRILPSIMER